MVFPWFGMKISDQTVPVTCYFSVKERDGLPGPLGGKFDGSVICIDIVYDINLSSPCVQTANMSSMYLHQMVGLCVN